MAYAGGFLIPVPIKNLAACRKPPRRAAEVWMEHGALDYKECAGDDMTADGMVTSFPKAMKLKAGDTLVFSWIVHASKAERNRIRKLVMNDKRLAKTPDPMPCDPRHMLYGGFEVVVDMASQLAPRTGEKMAANKKAAAKKKPARKRARR